MPPSPNPEGFQDVGRRTSGEPAERTLVRDQGEARSPTNPQFERQGIKY
jgi:hypothetical protein